MEQHEVPGSAADTGGSGSAAPPGTEPSTAQPAPSAAQAQDPGKEEPMEKVVGAAGELHGGTAEPAQEKVPTAAGKEEPGKEKAPGAAAEAEGAAKEKAEPKGGKAEPAQEAVPNVAQHWDGGEKKAAKEGASAAETDRGKAEAAAGGGGKEEPTKEKPPVGEAGGQTAEPAQGKGSAVAGAQKEPPKENAPGAPGAEPGGEAEPAEKASAAAEAEGGKAEPAGTAPAAAPAQGVGEPVKEGPAAAKAEDGGKSAAKAKKSPAAKQPAKEKAPAAAKAPDGGKKPTKVEKNAAVTKAQDGGKEPAKEKAAAPAKEKATDAAQKPPTAAKAEDGGQETAEKAPAAAEAQGEGKKEANAEQTNKKQPPRGTEPTRPALMQSLSCPATCQREEQPGPEVAAMETIPEENPTALAGEGLAEPTPAQGDLQPPEQPVPQERTLPGAEGQPQLGSEPPGHAEQPGPGATGQPAATVAEPPPSPYLTPDFGKEDPFEILDDVPPPPAPFAHRIITLRTASVSSQYNLSTKEILGGGKFGEVHTCTEKQTGLKLAAKVIRKQGAKDKVCGGSRALGTWSWGSAGSDTSAMVGVLPQEMVLLEIDVMNQLNHRNLIQLYDAIETPREIILFMEFVEGGELFERIIDDDYHLTEVDCMVFVRQICEGIRFMHHMRVLHLDLKPENILCVAATGHMVKIIDFGLARRYNPQEKLKVNFGTPEFLSPEVVNYEQVSYSTDMWSMGVITYMLLSGLSPFLGDNDTETLNNVLAANWYFDEETFESVSDEAKDFVSNLIIKEKSARMSAGQCLQHPWLTNLAEKAKRCNRRLKSQVLLKKYVMRRRWKKNFIGVCAANRFKKITSSGSLTALGV
ncbi:myosin light chain kinase 2, skeletal/cardiac muscle [Numida meleagris]|uniref:myosin light chain kinase 2, skeletal/cardiac muscle n=1 Tax=Numida meleagris TaxID=8996 RepID=UPI000B3DEAB0|nr:myosin light chain kinase 2, skeletal/cardiac muscle [Numida meleagris]